MLSSFYIGGPVLCEKHRPFRFVFSIYVLPHWVQHTVCGFWYLHFSAKERHLKMAGKSRDLRTFCFLTYKTAGECGKSRPFCKQCKGCSVRFADSHLAKAKLYLAMPGQVLFPDSHSCRLQFPPAENDFRIVRNVNAYGIGAVVEDNVEAVPPLLYYSVREILDLHSGL